MKKINSIDWDNVQNFYNIRLCNSVGRVHPFLRMESRVQVPPGSQFGDVAQLVEQRTENPCVTGSIPVIPTNWRWSEWTRSLS